MGEKMRFLPAFIAVLVLGICTSFARSAILNANCYNDGDGAIEMTYWHWDDVNSIVDMDEKLKWSPAHALVDFTLDSPLDPIAWIYKDVENGTPFAWTNYQIKVMRVDQTFSILDAVGPAGWDYPATITPVAWNPTGGLLGTGAYEGTVDFAQGMGSSIAIGDFGLFKVKLSFLGNSSGLVNFCLQQIPTPVPEPGTLMLLVAGSLAMLRRRAA
jgi:hypothetical protein